MPRPEPAPLPSRATAPPVTVSTPTFTDAMRLMPAGVSVVTAAAGGRKGGFTATAVCSVAAEPPHLLVCANRAMDSHRLMLEAGHFAVNLLARHHEALADRFGGRDGIEGEARFSGGPWTTLATGAPTLPDACAVFDCRVTQTLSVATHDVIIGVVLAVSTNPHYQALVYVDRDYTRTAPPGLE